ncbi:MAG: glycogen synthase [Candidatus Eisenbacteria bacterium]|nr:glycogen synthase [Candidatus Eisenbacteria bacterium]
MRILIAAAEVAPFARVGGLSDVAGALAKEIARAGHDVSVFLPRYASIDGTAFGLQPVAGLGPVGVPMGDREERASLFRAPMPGEPRVSVFFVGHEGYFGRPGIYTDPATGHGYPDEVERYAFFCRALLVFAEAMGLAPDVVHLNDHHTALAAAYLRGPNPHAGALSRAGVVFSIHNLGYQGWFDRDLLPRLGFSSELCSPGSPFEFSGRVNALKLGIEFADFVNTVSERYAIEISTTAEFGLGLEGVLADKASRGRLIGILNGVDTAVWDPATDPLIPAHYSVSDMRGKTACREALTKRCGLSVSSRAPVVGIVSRLADQKGLDLIREIADEMIGLDLALAVLGTGDRAYHEFLTGLAAKYRGRVSVDLRFDDELAHWIEAGSDMFLMPSRYEPCGLNQMYSLRYGTVPVVRETGGLADTVTDYDASKNTGTGFSFREYRADALLSALRRAVGTFREPDRWAGIVRRGMQLDLSWAASALRYARLYEDAAAARRKAEAGELRA